MGKSYSSPEHSRTCGQKDRTENPSQPKYRNPSAQVRAHQPAGNGANEERTYQAKIDIAQAPMKQAGNPGKRDGMHNVGSDHYFGWKTVKQQQQHHNNAARSHGSHAYQETREEPNKRHADKGFHCRRAISDVFLNPGLE